MAVALTVNGRRHELKIEPNYLYRVMPGLEQEGKIKRDSDKGYHPVAGS